MDNKFLQLKIITPDTILFQGEILRIQAPGASGSFEILYDHAPFVSVLIEGRIRIHHLTSEIQYFDIQSGTLTVADNTVLILLDS